MAKSKYKKLIIIAVLLFITIFSITLVYNYLKITDFTVVATVNGMDITAGELKNEMLRNKSFIISDYSNKYKVDINKSFWNTKFDGQTPMEYLRELSLENVKQYKLTQQLALKYNLIKDASYKAFLKEMEKENKQRAEKIAAGQVVYGAKEYTIDTFYDYTLSNLIIKLKQVMSQENHPLYADDEMLQKFYNEVKATSYKKIDNYTLKAFTLKFKSEIEQSNYTKEQALKLMNEVSKIIEKGNYEKIKKDYPQIEILELNLNHENASSASKTHPIMYQKAITMKTGETTEVFEDTSSYRILKCEKVTSAGYIEFNEIKDSVISQYNDQKFDEYMSELTNKYKATKLEKYHKVTIK